MTFISSPIVLVLVGVIGLLVGLLIGFLFIDRDSRKSKSAGVPEEFAKDGFLKSRGCFIRLPRNALYPSWMESSSGKPKI